MHTRSVPRIARELLPARGARESPPAGPRLSLDAVPRAQIIKCLSLVPAEWF